MFDKIRELFKFKETNKIYRLGKLFITDENKYLYDTGTGKVLLLDEESYNILNCLLDEKDKTTWEEFEFSLNENKIKIAEELNNAIIQENLFLAPPVDKLYTYNHYENLENNVNNNLEQVILELTGRCNLRCGYCIYNESYNGNRDFNNEDMTKETAKASIDYVKEHAADEISVTFYGGEPLVKFDLLKWCIEYAKDVLKDKKIAFSFTTNLTLVTDEISKYLGSVDNLTILCSLDGPEEIQNSYRKYIDGKGSFDNAIKGLRYLVEAFKDNSTNKISINGVFAPPYTFEKIEKINEFFKSLEWLPKDIDIAIDYASEGTVDDEKHLQELKKDSRYVDDNGRFISPLWKWGKDKFTKYDHLEKNLGQLYDENSKDSLINVNIKKSLTRIHKRQLSKTPIPVYPFNSCCVPGSRRLYINTLGDFNVCERIGLSPSIGNAYEGINLEKLRKHYVYDYSKGAVEACSKCWAIRMCNDCYVGAYTKEGFNKEAKLSSCDGIRNKVEKELILYHSVLESETEKLKFLDDIIIK